MTDSMETRVLPVEVDRSRQPKDLRRFWRILAAVAIPLGPLGIVVSRAVMPYWTNDDAATIVANTLANPGTVALLGWLGLVVYPAILLGILCLGYVARRGSPVLATIGTVLTFLAFANWTAGGGGDYLNHVLGQNGFDAATIVRLNEALQADPLVTAAGLGWLVGHIVGMVILGIALGRSHVVRWWVGIALAASQPIHLIAAMIIPSRWLDVTLGWGLTTLCCVMVSIAVVRMPVDDWDLPPGA